VVTSARRLGVRSATMAYDEELAHRIREVLSGQRGITEKAMFGGLAFLLNGNMAVSASGQGGLLVRIDPADTSAALAKPHVGLMVMGGRSMDGWIRVAPEGIKTKRELGAWVKRGVDYAGSLPAKGPKKAGAAKAGVATKAGVANKAVPAKKAKATKATRPRS
jgi:hypothetical protein